MNRPSTGMLLRIGVSLVLGLFTLLLSLGIFAATAVILIGCVLLVGPNIAGYEQIPLPTAVLLSLYALIAGGSLVYAARRVISTIREERETLVAPDTTAAALPEDLSASIGSLAAQQGIPIPRVHLREASFPICYTTYPPDESILPSKDTSPVIVVSRGLYEILPPEELEAVLTHEIAYITNDDVRLTTLIRIPLIFAEALQSGVGHPTNLIELAGRMLTSLATVGVGVTSRGRELAADRAAAVLTGNPAALMSALSRIDDHVPTPPEEDLREFARSTSAIAFYPVTESVETHGPLHSIPISKHDTLPSEVLSHLSKPYATPMTNSRAKKFG